MFSVQFLRHGKPQHLFKVKTVNDGSQDQGLPDVLDTFGNMPKPLQGAIMRSSWVSIGNNVWERKLTKADGSKVYGVLVATK